MRGHAQRLGSVFLTFTSSMKFLQFSIVVSFSLCTIGNALNCPPLEMNGSSQYELVSRLTHRCRYDPQVRPVLVHGEPLAVRARLYIYHLQMKHSTALYYLVDHRSLRYPCQFASQVKSFDRCSVHIFQCGDQSTRRSLQDSFVFQWPLVGQFVFG
ncbi:hypothetical protein J6590_014230 [Homalodisca vitripennis]|nr:hypothetical protein J6590_014230 [Homalodisca vitripennis]